MTALLKAPFHADHVDSLLRPADLHEARTKAAQYIDLERLCLSPQCGFSSTHHGNKITKADAIAKLRLIVETAAEVWG